MSQTNQDSAKSRSLLDLFRVPPRKYYLFSPAWRVPEWLEAVEPAKSAPPNWRKGYGRFVSFTFVIRESGCVKVWPIGINTGMIFAIDDHTILRGAPTRWCAKFMVAMPHDHVKVAYCYSLGKERV